MGVPASNLNQRALFPSIPNPRMVPPRNVEVVPYPRSWDFDYEAGEFRMDGSGRFVIADGYLAWAQGCVNRVMTERFAYLAYSDQYGVEIDRALRQPGRLTREAYLQRTIVEALMGDRRTGQVSDFVFDWNPTEGGTTADRLAISFTVAPAVGTKRRITVHL